uniref:Uncharacterized protein n=1 Tax=Arundo donax TaxID=35708 RepID=A0A0A9ADN6_ARUDO
MLSGNRQMPKSRLLTLSPVQTKGLSWYIAMSSIETWMLMRVITVSLFAQLKMHYLGCRMQLLMH